MLIGDLTKFRVELANFGKVRRLTRKSVYRQIKEIVALRGGAG